MDRTKKRRRWFWLGALGFALFVSGFVWWTNSSVLAAGEGRIFADPAAVPPTAVALVLGTAPNFNGGKNAFFERRMDAAAKLYLSGRIEKILVSGDNHVATYDEPTAMKEALISRGVPAERIVLDYAGFHTLDSIVRAKKVFGVDRCVIVTDDFHLPRALYIADSAGLGAVGFQTQPLDRSVSPRTYFREIWSRSLVWLDLHVLNRQPKFLGPHESI